MMPKNLIYNISMFALSTSAYITKKQEAAEGFLFYHAFNFPSVMRAAFINHVGL
jgi:hypothetical protein